MLLLTDRVDEWVMSHLTEFAGKALASVTKGDLDLGKLADETEPQKPSEAQNAHQELVARIKKALGDRVKDVRPSQRLVDSPACLVVDAHDISANLKRLLKAAGQSYPESRPILEINAEHPLLKRLRDESDEKRVENWSALLLDQAILSEGGQLEDPAAFVRRLNDVLLVAAQAR